MEAVTTGVTNLIDIVGSTLDALTAEPILMVFFCSGLVGIAVSVIRKFKRA